jgi:NodT family efflux transporter outer membrane factor (OMF) lipoprotein
MLFKFSLESFQLRAAIRRPVSYLSTLSCPTVRRRRLFNIAACAALSGCTVGPDYHRSALPPEAGYISPARPLELSAPAEQRFVSDYEVPARWWEEFKSPQINHLVEEAVVKNPDLASAQATLRAAHASLAAQRGTLFPGVDGSFSASRQGNSNTLASPLNSNAEDYSLYTGQISIGYSPDVFGGIHRQIEAVEAQAENQKFAVEAAYLTLTTNVVVAAIQVGSLREQIAANEAIIKADQEVLDGLDLQERMGQASESDVAAQESAVAIAKTALPPLRKQLGQQEHFLAQLTGETPAEFSEVQIELQNLQLPSELPLSVPSKLIEQRPDIRAAEANLHAASALVGVSIANRLPNISLSAALGGASTDIGTLIAGGNTLWAVTGGVTQPIFDAGALKNKQRAAEAQLDQAKEQYRSTVLSALQNVADVLLALEEDTDAVTIARTAQSAAQKSLLLARTKLQQGEGNTTAVLNAQQVYEQAVAALVQAQASRFADTTGLFQALGGGWWLRGAADQSPAQSASLN